MNRAENTRKVQSSPILAGDTVRAGDDSGDDWSRELARARVVQGLKEMVVALVQVGDFEGASAVSALLTSLDAQPSKLAPLPIEV